MAPAPALALAAAALLAGWPRCAAQRLGEGSFAGCDFELVMVDNRPWRRLGVASMPHWVMAALVNFAYASRFGYGFRLARPVGQDGTGYPGWNKVLYLRDRLDELDAAAGAARCSWLLYLDADAFVRQPDLPLPVFLAGLAQRYSLPAEAGLLLTREVNLTGSGMEAPRAAFLNTGVLLLRAGPRGRRVLEAWLLAGRHVERKRLWTTWPGEQGILSELLLPGSYPPARSASGGQPPGRRAFAVVNMTEMNSPWGRFVQHSWGKTATECLLRDRALRDALLRLDCLEPVCLARLRKGVEGSVVNWIPQGDM